MPAIPISEMKLDQLKIKIPDGISYNFIKSFKPNKIGNTTFSDINNPTVDKIKEYIEKYYSADVSIISVYHKTIKEKTHKGFTNTKEIIEILSIDYDTQKGTATNLVMEFDVNHKLTVSYEWKMADDVEKKLISQDFLRFEKHINVDDNTITAIPYYLHADVFNSLFEIIENYLGESINGWTNGKIEYLK